MEHREKLCYQTNNEQANDSKLKFVATRLREYPPFYIRLEGRDIGFNLDATRIGA
jgi:hypothetical protein